MLFRPSQLQLTVGILLTMVLTNQSSTSCASSPKEKALQAQLQAVIAALAKEHIAGVRVPKITCRAQKKSTDKYQCLICKNYYSNLKIHMLIHNPRPLDLTCTECGKSSVDTQRFKNHLKTHKKTVLQCHLCEKSYSNRGNLNRHISMHDSTPPSFACLLCSQTFSRNHDLTRHTKKIHADMQVPIEALFTLQPQDM